MLLFIGDFVWHRTAAVEFQYISCYCLSIWIDGRITFLIISIHLMLLFIWMQGLPTAFPVSFQYISCYCLSGWFAHRNLWRHISIHLMLLFIPPIMLSKSIRPVFQYISCYCLSMSLSFVTLDFANFNTSHVTVYQWYYDSRLFTFIDFNTSHVTVYPELIQKWTMLKCISIHLMLLFIGLFNLATKGCDSFQYISCYCLSYTNHCFRLVHIHFNTSHVTVYRTRVIRNGEVVKISIHLMLLFIPALLPVSSKQS